MAFDIASIIPAAIGGIIDGIVKAAVVSGMPEEEARAKVRATVIAHAGFLEGELAASDVEAAAARAAADAQLAAARARFLAEHAGAPVPTAAVPGDPTATAPGPVTFVTPMDPPRDPDPFSDS